MSQIGETKETEPTRVTYNFEKNSTYITIPQHQAHLFLQKGFLKRLFCSQVKLNKIEASKQKPCQTLPLKRRRGRPRKEVQDGDQLKKARPEIPIPPPQAYPSHLYPHHPYYLPLPCNCIACFHQQRPTLVPHPMQLPMYQIPFNGSSQFNPVGHYNFAGQQQPPPPPGHPSQFYLNPYHQFLHQGPNNLTPNQMNVQHAVRGYPTQTVSKIIPNTVEGENWRISFPEKSLGQNVNAINWIVPHTPLPDSIPIPTQGVESQDLSESIEEIENYVNIETQEKSKNSDVLQLALNLSKIPSEKAESDKEEIQVPVKENSPQYSRPLNSLDFLFEDDENDNSELSNNSHKALVADCINTSVPEPLSQLPLPSSASSLTDGEINNRKQLNEGLEQNKLLDEALEIAHQIIYSDFIQQWAQTLPPLPSDLEDCDPSSLFAEADTRKTTSIALRDKTIAPKAHVPINQQPLLVFEDTLHSIVKESRKKRKKRSRIEKDSKVKVKKSKVAKNTLILKNEIIELRPFSLRLLRLDENVVKFFRRKQNLDKLPTNRQENTLRKQNEEKSDKSKSTISFKTAGESQDQFTPEKVSKIEIKTPISLINKTIEDIFNTSTNNEDPTTKNKITIYKESPCNSQTKESPSVQRETKESPSVQRETKESPSVQRETKESPHSQNPKNKDEIIVGNSQGPYYDLKIDEESQDADILSLFADDDDDLML